MTDSPKRPRAGFALPMTILALALMTAAIVAAFSSTSAETVANNAMRAQDRAYQMAEAGLQQFLLRRNEAGFCLNCVADPAAADSEWTRVNLTGGYANVVATRVRPKLAENSPALFFIRSTGTDTVARLSGAATTYATRTVGVYASYGTASIKALAAWTSLNGITSTTNRTPGLGTDACAATSAVAGVTVPKGGQWNRTSGPLPSGSPAVDSTLLLDSLKLRAGIDWNAIKNSDAIPADVTIPTNSFPSGFAFSDTSYWPVIRIKTPYQIPRTGRGLIIADSIVYFPPDVEWQGIVLVGGQFYAGEENNNGNDTIHGAVISGLNRTLPGMVNPPNGTTNDNDWILEPFVVAYNSCKAARAAQRLKQYFTWSNTWLDNVAVW
jgi:Tfp pilus assembly protein PilX